MGWGILGNGGELSVRGEAQTELRGRIEDVGHFGHFRTSGGRRGCGDGGRMVWGAVHGASTYTGGAARGERRARNAFWRDAAGGFRMWIIFLIRRVFVCRHGALAAGG